MRIMCFLGMGLVVILTVPFCNKHQAMGDFFSGSEPAPPEGGLSGKTPAERSKGTDGPPPVQGWIPRAAWKCPGNEVYAVAFSRDGKMLASCGCELDAKNNLVGLIHLWDVKTRKLSATLTGHASNVDSVAFSADGKLLASASFGGTARVWDVAEGKQLARFQGHARGGVPHALALSSNGKTIAWGDADGTLVIWDVPTGKEKARFDSKQTGGVRSLAFTTDGKKLISNGRSFVAQWDIASRQKTVLAKHKEMVAVLRPVVVGGSRLVAACDGNELRFWDLETGKETGAMKWYDAQKKGVFTGELYLAITPDGRTLAAATIFGTLAVWDVATKAVRGRHTRTGSYTMVTVSPDGALLASLLGFGTEEKRMIQLWDVPPLKESGK